MAVGVDEAMCVHEAKVLGLVVGRASRGDGPRDEIVDLLPALTTEVEEDFHCLGRIADGLGVNSRNLACVPSMTKIVSLMTARGPIAGELRMERVAERLIKGRRFRQVGDGDVEENLFVQGLGCFRRGLRCVK